MKAACLFSLLLLGVVSPIAAQSTIFIVRHAEKEQAGNDPALSAVGRARAETLATILKDAQVSAIYATGYRRTRETAAPLARALHLPILESHAPWRELPENTLADLSPAAANMSDLALHLQRTPGNALVVGHTNTIPALVRSLGLADSIMIQENDYDNLFVVVIGDKPYLLHLHF